MPDITTNIADSIIKNTVLLDRFAEGTKNKVIDILNKAQDEIVGAIASNDPNAPTLTKWREERYKKLNKRIDEILDSAYTDAKKTHVTDLKGMTTPIAGKTVSDLNAAVGVNLFDVTLTPELLEGIVGKTMIDGNIIGAWWDKQTQDAKMKLAQTMNLAKEQLQIGMVEGQSIGELVGRIRGTKLTPGVMSVSKREAEALVRTSVHQVAQSVRMEVYKQNEDIFSGYEVCATLDRRTTPLCRALDRKRFDLNFLPVGHNVPYPVGGPPFHWQCRTTLIPITKSYRELAEGVSGLSKKKKDLLANIPIGQRASMGGPVAGRLDYNEWLQTQSENVQIEVLGATRQKLWKENKLTMVDLIHQNGRQLTLGELKSYIGDGTAIVQRRQILLDQLQMMAQQLLTQEDWAIYLDTMPEGKEALSVISEKGFSPESFFTKYSAPEPEQVPLKYKWEMAQKKKDVKANFKQFGIDEVVYGSDPEIVNAVNAVGEELTRMFNMFPELEKRLGYDPGETHLKKLSFINNKYIKHGKNACNGIHFGKNTQISLAVLKRSVIDYETPIFGEWSMSGGNVRGVFRHEFGHQISKACMSKGEVGEWKKIWESHPENWWKTNLTQYSATNGKEAFAEAFTVFTHPNYVAGSLPADIEKFMTKILTKSDDYKVWKLESDAKMFAKIEMNVEENIVSFGGKKFYDLSIPAEKEQFEKIHGFYLQKWKSAMVAGQEPGAAFKTAFEMLPKEQQELWLTKVENAKLKKGLIVAEKKVAEVEVAVKETAEEVAKKELTEYWSSKDSSYWANFFTENPNVEAGFKAFTKPKDKLEFLKMQEEKYAIKLQAKQDFLDWTALHKDEYEAFLKAKPEFASGYVDNPNVPWSSKKLDHIKTVVGKYHETEFQTLSMSDDVLEMYKVHPEWKGYVADETLPTSQKTGILKADLQQWEIEKGNWEQALNDYYGINVDKISGVIQKNPGWANEFNLTPLNKKLDMVKEAVDKWEKEQTTAQIVSIGGKTKYNLSIPAEKEQFEKIQGFYLQKYKNAMVKGEKPAAAFQKAYDLLSPDQKEVWDLKIEKALGKIGTKAPPKTVMSVEGKEALNGLSPEVKWLIENTEAGQNMWMKGDLTDWQIFHGMDELDQFDMLMKNGVKEADLATAKIMAPPKVEVVDWNKKTNDLLFKIDEEKLFEEIAKYDEHFWDAYDLENLSGEAYYNAIKNGVSGFQKTKIDEILASPEGDKWFQNFTITEKFDFSKKPVEEQYQILKKAGLLKKKVVQEVEELDPEALAKMKMEKIWELNKAKKIKLTDLETMVSDSFDGSYQDTYDWWENAEHAKSKNNLTPEEIKQIKNIGRKASVKETKTLAQDTKELAKKKIQYLLDNDFVSDDIAKNMDDFLFIYSSDPKKALELFIQDAQTNFGPKSFKNMLDELETKFGGGATKEIPKDKPGAWSGSAKADDIAKKKLKYILDNEPGYGFTDVDDIIKYYNANSAEMALEDLLQEIAEAEGLTKAHSLIDNLDSQFGKILKDAAPEPPKVTIPPPAPEPQKSILNFDDMIKYGEQKGSNKGGFYHLKDNPAERYYIKTPSNLEIARNEVLTSKLYQAAGVEVPELQFIDVGGSQGIASRIIDGIHKIDQNELAAGKILGVGDGFVTDCWLGDWDVVGEVYDNLVQVGNRAVRIDVGGGLRFRAQGAPKGQAFGKTVGEFDSMRDPRTNVQTSTIFKYVKKSELEAGAKKVCAISDDTIRELVEQYGPLNKTERDQLTETLIARKKDIAEKFGIKIEELKKVAPEPEDLKSVVTKVEQERIAKARSTGYSVRFDKEEIEDHNVWFWTEKKSEGGNRTVASLKLRGNGADKLQKIVEPAIQKAGTPTTVSTTEVYNNTITALKGIFQGVDQNRALRPQDIERAKSAVNTFDKMKAKLVQLENDGDIAKGSVGKFLTHYGNHIDFLREISVKNVGDMPWRPDVLKGDLKALDDFQKIIKKAEEKKQEFNFARKKGRFEVKKLEKGHINVTDQPGIEWETFFETEIDGVRVRYWPDTSEICLSNRGKLEMVTNGVGKDTSEKLVATLKKLGVDSDRSTAIDDEMMYLKQILNHAGDYGKGRLASTAITEEERLKELKELREYTSKKLGVADITKLKEYNPAGTRTAFDEGLNVRLRPDLPEQKDYQKFREDYVLIHQNYDHTTTWPQLVEKLLNSGGQFIPSTRKFDLGLRLAGMSPGSDMANGTSPYVFTRINKASSMLHSQQFVWDVDHIRRLDCLPFDGDSIYWAGLRHGEDAWLPHKKGTVREWKHNATISNNEVLFKDQLSMFDKLKYVVCANDSETRQIIKIFKDHGYEAFPDGRALDAVIVTKSY